MTDKMVATLTLEDAEVLLANAVYVATALLEKLERVGKTHGNGHHQRQAVAKAAVDQLRAAWKEPTS